MAKQKLDRERAAADGRYVFQDNSPLNSKFVLSPAIREVDGSLTFTMARRLAPNIVIDGMEFMILRCSNGVITMVASNGAYLAGTMKNIERVDGDGRTLDMVEIAIQFPNTQRSN